LAAITTSVVPVTGLRFDNLLAAANSSDDAETGSGVLLIVKNASGSSINVTITTPETFDGDLTLQDRVVAVPATTGETIIPLGTRYRDSTTGRATIAFSATTSVTRCVVRVAT
jgi:hypothetical protein